MSVFVSLVYLSLQNSVWPCYLEYYSIFPSRRNALMKWYTKLYLKKFKSDWESRIQWKTCNTYMYHWPLMTEGLKYGVWVWSKPTFRRNPPRAIGVFIYWFPNYRAWMGVKSFFSTPLLLRLYTGLQYTSSVLACSKTYLGRIFQCYMNLLLRIYLVFAFSMLTIRGIELYFRSRKTFVYATKIG